MDFIEIRGYKSIKHAEIPLQPINIFIGANGSGKSNLISFFEFLNRFYNRKMNDYINLSGGPNKFLHRGVKVTDSIFFHVEFDNGNNGYSAEIKRGANQFIVTSEKLHYRQDAGKDIAESDSESRLEKADNYRIRYIKAYLNGFRKYHFHDTTLNSDFSKSSNIINDKYFLYEKGSNLAAFLYNIRHTNPNTYRIITRTIQSIAPYFHDFYFPDDATSYIYLQWTDKYSETVYGFSDFSDGTLRFIALVALFLQPKLPKTIIIDEPELGLHPSAIAKLAGLIQSAAENGCQVILATQSADLIQHFNAEDIITVDQINGESKFSRLRTEALENWLEDYSLDELWRRNIINSGQLNY